MTGNRFAPILGPMARETRQALIALYLTAAVINLVFQLSIRSDPCAGAGNCAASYTKAVLWSAVWPASLAVYLAGRIRS